MEVELNVQEYLGHAQQSEESRARIGVLLEKGLDDKDVSQYFILKDNALFFKRNVYLILGEKPFKDC